MEKTTKVEEYIRLYWRSCWQTPDLRPVWEWGDDEVVLKNSPFGSKFNSSVTPWLREPLEVFADNRYRELTMQCCVQGGKTVALQVMLAWSICHDPAPAFVTMQTDDDARDFAKERMLPMLKLSPVTASRMPAIKGNETICSVSFPDMFLLMQGANLSNLQSKSVRWIFNDEVWLWDPGLLQHARDRGTQYWNRRIVNASTAGDKDSDIDIAFRSGDMREFHLLCPECGKLSLPKWERIKWDTNEYTKPNGVWDFSRVVGTVRYECEHCRKPIPHTERTHKTMVNGGKYIATNPNPIPGHLSWHWNALCLSPSTVSWSDLVLEWLKANEAWDLGSTIPRADFVRKRLAESWEEWSYHTAPTIPTVEIQTDWPDEKHRFMTVDVQEREFWVVVRAWGESESRLLHAGKLLTWEEVAELQEKWKVKDSCVLVDASYDTRKVYEECARHSKIYQLANGKRDWFGWVALRGVETPGKQFVYRPKGGRPLVLPYSWPPTYVDPLAGKLGAGKTFAKLHYWSNDVIKDILCRFRDQRSKGFAWLAFDGVDKEWSKQMFAERRLEIVDKLGQRKLRWQQIGNRPNHLWDCECMQVVGACMAGLVGEKLQSI